MELLVVLVLLGLIATSLLPAAGAMVDRVSEQDVSQRLKTSWSMSRALAVAMHRPVIWQIQQQSSGAVIQLRVTGQSSWEPKQIVLLGWQVDVEQGPLPIQRGLWQVVVGTHGLTESLRLRLRKQDRELLVELPGIIEQVHQFTAMGGST